jgi:hypothetical protein
MFYLSAFFSEVSFRCDRNYIDAATQTYIKQSLHVRIKCKTRRDAVFKIIHVPCGKLVLPILIPTTAQY